MAEPSRPSFAKDFPASRELEPVLAAFARGDYAFVRKAGESLAARADLDEGVTRAARLIVERTRPDPLAVGLLGITAALLVALGGYWIASGHPPSGDSPVEPRRGAVERSPGASSERIQAGHDGKAVGP